MNEGILARQSLDLQIAISMQLIVTRSTYADDTVKVKDSQRWP